jgi:predicted nucleic acid-binding protein
LSLFVDTSVWSLAFRRDAPTASPHVEYLIAALTEGRSLISTGIVLQELLQGYSGPKQHVALLSRFASVPLLPPDRDDHIAAAELRNQCRRAGVQLGTIDALLARLCIRHDMTMLSADGDFRNIPRRFGLKLWVAAG